MKKPNKAQWKGLYEAAIAFQQTAPWKWMANEDIFAVVSPVNEEIGYCSILGNGGEEFGLGISLGDVGLRWLMGLIEEEKADDPSDMVMTPLLTLLLTSRDVLYEEDRKIIRSLGLRFRGRNAWPLFRSQRPGCAPWFLEKDEAIYLTAALWQALEIARRVRAGDLDLQGNLARGKIITRYPSDKGWKERWDSVRRTTHDRAGSLEPLEVTDEAALLLLSNRAKRCSASWEFDIFVVPICMGPAGARPYYPLCFMAVDAERGQILHAEMTEPWLTTSEKRQEVIRFLERSEALPEEIKVSSQDTRAVLQPVAHALGISLRVSRLHRLQEAKDSLLGYLSSGNL